MVILARAKNLSKQSQPLRYECQAGDKVIIHAGESGEGVENVEFGSGVVGAVSVMAGR